MRRSMVNFHPKFYVDLVGREEEQDNNILGVLQKWSLKLMVQ